MSRQRHPNRHREKQTPRSLVDEAHDRAVVVQTALEVSGKQRQGPILNSLQLTGGVKHQGEAARTTVDWNFMGTTGSEEA